MHNKHIEDEEADVTVSSRTLENVDFYIYLGQRISMNTCKEMEIKIRISMGWQAFSRHSAILKDKRMPLCLKRQVYNKCVLPVVTYGVQTWNLSKKTLLKLRTMQRAHERIMLDITWKDRKKKPHGSVREQTKLRDILYTISKLKWDWAGHVARQSDNRWMCCLTHWTQQGHTRNRGRPKTR